MKDPARPPGYSFDEVRLVQARYELGPEPPEDAQAELEWIYDDKVVVKERSIVLRQELLARLVGSPTKEPVYLRASVTVEGRFAGTPDANLEPADFAEHHAPAILFGFTREWMHRLTSSAGPWPAILIPPVNVLEMRKKKPSAAAK